MFPATITLHTAQQLHAVLRALDGLVPLTASDFKSPAVGVAYEEVAARVAAHDAEVTTAQLIEIAQARGQAVADQAEAPAPAPAAAPAPETPAEPVTYAQVAAAITATVKVDRQRVIDTLAEFGVQKGPQLKPEQFAPFLAALNAEVVS